jgi:hypothetical protein
MQLRKVCNHPYLFQPWANEFLVDRNFVRASGKFALLDNILPKLAAGGHRVLLFSQFTQLLDLLAIYLSFRRHRHLRLDGHTIASDRTKLLEDFNAPGSPYFIFILSTKAGGLGLNLQSADTVIIFDSDWNPQMDLQAQARAHRIGQEKEVLVLRFVTADSVETHMLNQCNMKLDKEDIILRSGMFVTDFDSTQHRSNLERIIREGGSIGTNAAVTSDAEINELISRNDGEREMFKAMDAKREIKDLIRDEELPLFLGHLFHKINTDANTKPEVVPSSRRRQSAAAKLAAAAVKPQHHVLDVRAAMFDVLDQLRDFKKDGRSVVAELESVAVDGSCIADVLKKLESGSFHTGVDFEMELSSILGALKESSQVSSEASALLVNLSF